MRKEIKNYEGLYEADSDGFIIKVSREQKDKRYGERTKEVVLKPYFTKMKNGSKGYGIVTLCKNGIKQKVTVHSIIYSTFNSEYDTKKYCIDHIDGNKENNKLENLELVSYSENTNRAFSNNLMASEFNRSFCTTTEEQLNKAFEYVAMGFRDRQAEKMSGIPIGTICQIRKNKSYKSFYTKCLEASEQRSRLIPR